MRGTVSVSSDDGATWTDVEVTGDGLVIVPANGEHTLRWPADSTRLDVTGALSVQQIGRILRAHLAPELPPPETGKRKAQWKRERAPWRRRP